MNRSYYFDYVEEKLSVLAFRIGVRGRVNVLNMNVHAENFYVHLFNDLFGLSLVNANVYDQNAAAVDLVDASNKIIIQVSSTATKKKIESALSKDLSAYAGYLFLLGCDVDHGDRKSELLTRIRLEQSFKDRLEKEETRSAYETALALLDSEIVRLSKKKSRFNLNERLEADLSALNDLKYEISVVSSAITKLEMRRKLIVEASDDLNARAAKVDHRQLRLIYRQARQGMEGIQKTFEDLCNFHDMMLREKATYVTKELPKLEETIRERSESLNLLIGQQNVLTEKINHSDSFEELEKLMSELNEKYRKKGEYEKTIAQLREVDGNLAAYNRELAAIDDQLFSDGFGDIVREQVGKFNAFFSEISSTLYGEQYALKVDPVVNKKGQRLYKFSAFNTNFSSGKKQGEIFCFDIAYTLFADQEGIPCLHFLLNDKKELMHGNQLLNIANLVREKGIQFVASILHDKLPPELDDEKYFAVKLSQADKVLRIENVQGT